MKRILLMLPLIAFAVLSVAARALSPEQAWHRASTSALKSAPALAAVSTPELFTSLADAAGKDCIYIFDAGSTVYLVSADDCAIPLLGVCDNFPETEGEMPEAMREWLQGYVTEISEAARQNYPRYTASQQAAASYSSIAPLISTKWDQGSPYNNLCPIYSGSVRCYTGCVATAAAQIMYKHKYPDKGTGTFTHSDDIKGKTQTWTVDFGNTTYAWSAMTPTYGSSSSQSAKNAISTLMQHLGVASRMNYDHNGINSSGATLLDMGCGLIRNFNYSKGMRYLEKNHFSAEQWRALVYEELSAGRPLLYEGSTTSGHAFVCDGYDAAADRFHFNWGWSGRGDGYFSLSALTPSATGAGGGSYDYTGNQAALFGITKPVSANEAFYPAIKTLGDLIASNTICSRPGSIALNIINADYTGFYNYALSDDALQFRYGLELTDAAGNRSIVAGEDVISLEKMYGNETVYISFKNADLPEGDYTGRPVVCTCTAGGEMLSGWELVSIPAGRVSELKIHVGKYYLTSHNSLSTKVLLSASEVSTPSALEYAVPFNVETEVKADYADYNGAVVVMLKTEGGLSRSIGQSENITIPKGQSVRVSIPCELTNALSVAEADICLSAQGCCFYEGGTVSVLGGEAEYRFEPQDCPASVLPGEAFYINGLFTVEGAPYTGNIDCVVEVADGSIVSQAFTKSYANLSPGESKNLSFRMPGIEQEGDYTVRLLLDSGSLTLDGRLRVAKRKFRVEDVVYNPQTDVQDLTFLFDAKVGLVSDGEYNGYINFRIDKEDGTPYRLDWTDFNHLVLSGTESVAVSFNMPLYDTPIGNYTLQMYLPETVFDTEGDEIGERYPFTIFDSSSLQSVSASDTALYVDSAGDVHITGIKAGSLIKVYSGCGQELYSAISKETAMTIPASGWSCGVYILRVGENTFKFVR